MKNLNRKGVLAEKNRIHNTPKKDRPPIELYTDVEMEYAAKFTKADKKLLDKMRKEFGVKKKQKS
ncbi:hypothetical protein ACE1TH_15960 [Shouchella sp. JSM 1781072]|uniref:hypothetical protein n=1 Tax=Shouchella sp. JSM 1781072 TaxID=3344581 RepID=UPI0035C0AA5E